MAGFGGFFAGGLAEGFQQQQKQQSLAQYRTEELKLQQQAQQNAEKRQQMAEVDKSIEMVMKTVDETITNGKIVGTDPAKMMTGIEKYIAPAMRLYEQSGRDPAVLRGVIAAKLSQPSKTETTEAITRAGMKPTPMRLTDASGAQRIEFADPRNMSVTPASGGQQPSPGGGRAGLADETVGQVKDDSAVTKLPAGFQLPPGFQVPPGYTFPAIMAAAERYRQTGQFPPITRSRQNQPFFQGIQNLAASIDAFEGSDPKEGPKRWQQFKAEQIGIQRFLSGPQGNTIRSLNVVVDHLDTLKGLGEALQNGNIRLFNEIGNRWAAETGRPAPTNFDTAKGIIGTEVIKALGVAGAGTEAERAELGKRISGASSPAQLTGAINDVAAPLLAGQLGGLRRQFRPATGLPESKFDEMLYPRTREFLKAKSEKTSTNPASTGPQADPLGIR